MTTMKKLRKDAAELARECRSIKKSGDWSIKEWNDKIRHTIKNYMDNVLRFHLVHGTFED